MKKRTMFLDFSRLRTAGLMLLLFLSFSVFANGVQHNFMTVGTTMLTVSAQTDSKTNQKAKPATAKKQNVSQESHNRAYDKIDDKFKGIGPGNNTIPFIIALIIFLIAFGGMIKTKGKLKYVFIALTLLSLGYISKITYVEARALGRQQGYAPVQPIWFSHKVHAGQNGIDCEYCHVDARTSRHAGVPSLNVCMNCHNQVHEGSVSGKKEIAKIYEHLGYNPATQKYDKPGKPIQWIKVHNLPDHVYFSHAQHVQAGKVKCQECHGPVEEMNRVVEYKELAMGDFCLDCHRKRGIDTSNPYYKHYDFKKLMKKEGVDKITVDKIGGADCSSCHY